MNFWKEYISGQESPPFLDVICALCTLFYVKYGVSDAPLRSVLKELGESPLSVVPNDEDEELEKILAYSKSSSRQNKPLFFLDIVYVVSQFLDCHSGAISSTIFPSESDVQSYIEKILLEKNPATISRQYDILLGIAKGDPIQASYIGCVASRFMARAMDRRLYPNIEVSPDKIKAWSKKLASFPQDKQHCRGDGNGDAYYFWTHFFAAISCTTLFPDNLNVVSNLLFSNATSLMVLVRKYFAGQPTIGEYHASSLMGRNYGLAVAHHIKAEIQG